MFTRSNSFFISGVFSGFFSIALLVTFAAIDTFAQGTHAVVRTSYGTLAEVTERPVESAVRIRLISEWKGISDTKKQEDPDKEGPPPALRATKAPLSGAALALSLERRAFDILNQRRIENGLEVLVWSDDVARVARLHSENMARFKFFSHTGIDGLMVNDRADVLGFSKWKALGENIAYNRGYDNPAEFATERWMQSPSHRGNLLNKRWKEAGLGVAITADGTYYFTQVFVDR